MNNKNIYNTCANGLIGHYKTLVNHAENVVFSPIHLRLVHWPELGNKPRWQDILLGFVFPYVDFKMVLPAFYVALILFAWLFFWFFGINISGQILSYRSNDSLSWWLLVVLVPILLFTLSAYIQLIWFFVSPRNTGKIRLTGFVLLIAYIVGLYGLAITNLSTTTPSNSPYQHLVFFGITVPLLIILFWVLLQVALWIMQTGINFIVALLRSMRSLMINDIERLALEPIITKGQSWTLANLPLDEIVALRLLAEQNIETNEKKTVPGLIVMALLTLLVGVPFVQNPLNSLTQDITKMLLDVLSSRVNNPLEYGLGLIILVFGFLFAESMVDNFRNFIVQGVVQRACTVAAYAKQQEVMILAAQKETKPASSFALDKLLFFLFDLFFGKR
jgi:hypothetical protein